MPALSGLYVRGVDARARIRLRVDAGGIVRTVQFIGPQPSPIIASAIRSAAARAASGVRLPEGLIDPHTGEADLMFEVSIDGDDQTSETND